MEWVAITTAAMGAVAGVVGLVVAIRAEVRATRAARNADDSATRSANALEEANRIRLAENSPEKSPWLLVPTTGEGVRVRNESNRTAVVAGLSTDPPERRNAIVRPPSLPISVEGRDGFDFLFRTAARRVRGL